MNKPKQMQQNPRQLNRGYSPISFAFEQLTSRQPVTLNSSFKAPVGNHHPRQGEKSPQGSESGFTIIESLVAIIVVTILMIGLAPVITLSVATRVQARRVEQATQAASSYLDGVRTGAIPFGPTDAGDAEGTHDAITEDLASTPGDDLNQVPAPTKAAPNCSDNQYCTQPTQNNAVFYCVDGDGDDQCNSFQDFIIQAFGKIPTQGGEPNRIYRSYKLGVRVYRADAFTSDFTQGFEKDATQSSFTGGTGLSSTQAPLVIMSTEVAVGEDNLPEYRDICDNVGIGGC
ncbi:MAG: hormogonium polysaccharide secretion pseudopilin HpsB [Coleofasciculus sp. G1-WW12-02]|uniref:hormogonium polysaccharide secretion pseudopilin HpsB n=1 Tax=Coleofasciculus sp. G1-WW12-02 TaxID=3068483 RepID=UPI00330246FA